MPTPDHVVPLPVDGRQHPAGGQAGDRVLAADAAEDHGDPRPDTEFVAVGPVAIRLGQCTGHRCPTLPGGHRPGPGRRARLDRVNPPLHPRDPRCHRRPPRPGAGRTLQPAGGLRLDLRGQPNRRTGRDGVRPRTATRPGWRWRRRSVRSRAAGPSPSAAGWRPLTPSWSCCPRTSPWCSRRTAYLGVVGGRRRARHRYGGTVRRVDVADTAEVLAAAEGADLVWLETPTNPTIEVADLPGHRGRRCAGYPGRRGQHLRHSRCCSSR